MKLSVVHRVTEINKSLNQITDTVAPVNQTALLDGSKKAVQAMNLDGGWKTGSSSEYYQVDPGYKFDFWAVPGNSKKVYAHLSSCTKLQ